MSLDNQRDIILALKTEKERRGWSAQYITTRLEEMGMYLSLSSVKRVFSSGSENGSFRYDDTLKPLVHLLLGIAEPIPERIPGDEEQAEEYREQLESYKAIISIKGEQLETMEKERAFLLKEVDFLRSHYEDEKKSKKKVVWAVVILAVVLFVIVSAFIGVLVYDLTNLDRGWVQSVINHFSSNGSGLGLLL